MPTTPANVRERILEVHGTLFAVELELEDLNEPWAGRVAFDIGQAMAYLEDVIDELATE